MKGVAKKAAAAAPARASGEDGNLSSASDVDLTSQPLAASSSTSRGVTQKNLKRKAPDVDDDTEAFGMLVIV